MCREADGLEFSCVGPRCTLVLQAAGVTDTITFFATAFLATVDVGFPVGLQLSFDEAAAAVATASFRSLLFLDGWLAEGGPCSGTPNSLDLMQCMLMCLFKLNLVVKALLQLSQA